MNGRFVQADELPERLIDCRFNSVLGTPPIARGIGTQQQVVNPSQTRLVGVRCVGKDRHVQLLACVWVTYIECEFPVYINSTFDCGDIVI